MTFSLVYKYLMLICCFRSSAIPHKGGSAIPLPGSAIPARRCPPDKVRPVASSSRAGSPAMSMIPRGSPAGTQISSPYQTNGQQKNSMLDKLKLFKSNEKPVSSTNGKRTSSSSGVSSARSERSDSSASIEPSVDLKPVRNTSRLQQARPKKATPSKNSPSSGKKEIANGQAKPSKTASDVEKHAHKVANLPATKLAEPKVRVSSGKPSEVGVKNHHPPSNIPTHNVQHAPGTGIPKPTAAIKGTSKVARSEDKCVAAIKSPPSGLSRESSQNNISHKPAVALVSPMKNDKENQLSESSHSASTGHHSNSSESSVIYKPSSESGSEHHNIIPNRKEPLQYISDAEQTPPPPQPIISDPVKEKPDTPEKQEHEKLSPSDDNKNISPKRYVTPL